MIKISTLEFNVLDKGDFFEIQVPITEVLKPHEQKPTLKAIAKVQARIWVVHKYDADPFPSIPHAHDYQNKTKLDLYTGLEYRGKEVVNRLSEKALEAVQEKFRDQGVQIPRQ